MGRDHRKLRVFVQADALVLQVYRVSAAFPFDERHGLASQLRRASVSVAANLVEGSARRTTAEYRHFIHLALGSAAETAYLIDLSARLGYVTAKDVEPLKSNSAMLVRGLVALGRQLARME
ncbi:MAG: four helix bundle protein [Vicinamibacterales bacterium]